MKNYKNVILIMFILFVFTIGNTFAGTGVIVPVVGSDQQGQGQGQDQTIDQTFEASERAYAIPGQINLPALPGFFGDNNRPGHQFIPLDKLMMYDTTWDAAVVNEMVKNNTTGVNVQVTPMAKKMEKEENYSKSIICTKKKFDQEKFTVIQLAFCTVNTTNKEKISSDALGNLLKRAMAFGATHVQFLGEGTNTELSTTGWGIGFNHTEAGSTGITTGGTGFSTGWAGYNNLPWQQCIFLKVVDPNAVAAVEVEKTAKAEVVEPVKVVDAQVDKAVKVKQTGNHKN